MRVLFLPYFATFRYFWKKGNSKLCLFIIYLLFIIYSVIAVAPAVLCFYADSGFFRVGSMKVNSAVRTC